MRVIGVVVAIAVSSCAKKPVEHEPARPIDALTAADTPVATQVVIAGAGSGSAATDCDATLHRIFSDLSRSFSAMDANTPHQAALKAWPLVPAACQTGRWYLAAAILTVHGDKDLAAGNVKIASEESALTLALQQPDDLDVLKRVALISALGRKPALPDDACKRAKAVATDERAAYVCARSAIAAGDGKTATTELATIKAKSNYIDFHLAQAQAAKLTNDAKTRKAAAKLAMKLDYNKGLFAMIDDRDRKAIVALAKSLSK